MKIFDNKKFVVLTVALAVLIIAGWLVWQNYGTTVGKAAELQTISVSISAEPREMLSDAMLVGDKLNLTITVNNIGNVDATGIKVTLVDYKRETDTTKTYYLEPYPIPDALKKGYSINLTTDFTCTDSTDDAGTHTFVAIAMPSNDAATSNEITVECSPSLKLPDLGVGMVISKKNLGIGESAEISVAIDNRGAANVPATSTAVGVIKDNSLVIATTSLAGLQYGGDIKVFRATVTCNLKNLGSHVITASADPSNVLMESNESNNSRFDTIRCSAPDLIPSVDIHKDDPYLYWYGTATINGQVTNQGNSDAPTSNSQLIYIDNKGNKTVLEFYGAIGSKSSIQFQPITIDCGPDTNGIHTAYVVADILGKVTESNEANNKSEIVSVRCFDG